MLFVGTTAVNLTFTFSSSKKGFKLQDKMIEFYIVTPGSKSAPVEFELFSVSKFSHHANTKLRKKAVNSWISGASVELLWLC